MHVSLIVLGGSQSGRRIPIAVPEFLIGRDPVCHLRPVSKEVHWEHCALITREQGVFLRDLTGQAGVFLNRRQLVGGEMQLQDGDLIEVGPLTFKVAVEPQATEEVDAPVDEVRAARESGPDTRIPPRTGSRGLTSIAPTAAPLPALKPMKDCREMLCPM